MDNQTKQNVEVKRPSMWKETWRRLRKNRPAVFGLIVMLMFLLVVIFADVIVSYDTAIKVDIINQLLPPSSEHWFGTDGYGRDVFARVVHGCRSSLVIGFASTIIALLIGGFLGTVGAYYGGKLDGIIMRLNDILVAIPVMLLALAIVSALGPSLPNLIIAIAVARIPFFIRVIRSSVLGLADQEFVEAAKAGGISDAVIICKHILPNSIGTILVQSTMSVSFVILQAATLSFLGMGIQPPAPEWGYMLNEAREFARTSSYLMIFPGACICLAALSCSLLGDGLRDALDPRLKN